MKKYIVILNLVLFAIHFNCKAQTQIFSEELKKNITQRVEKGINTGIVIGVITADGTSFYSCGVKSLETNEPVDENSVFEIGSNTKTFTGILLANEVIKGELSLNTPLQDMLPEGITAPKRNGNSIKLFHLANHSSALPRTPDNFTITDPENKYANLSVQDVYEFINTYELPYDIGTKFNYSNLGMGLLGNVLAAKNNTSYEDLMIESIARPLGMNNTAIRLSAEMRKKLAKGHSTGVEVKNWDMPGMAGAGSISSTAVDMLKYLAANMGIVKSELYPAMQLSHKYSGSSIGDMTLGLGWVTMTVEGKEILWHNGGTGGYMSFMGFTKDGERGVVVLSNSAFMPDDIGIHLLSPKSKLRNPKPSIANLLNKLVEKEGIDSAVEVYKDLKENHAFEYNFSREELNRLGYRYLSMGKMSEALRIFKLNIEANANDWNVYDSYAEALLKNNEKKQAINYYKKSIELNPENTNGIEALKKLGVKIEKTEKKEN